MELQERSRGPQSWGAAVHDGLQHTRLPCPSPSPEFAETHVHQVGDVIQPSHSLSSPSPPAFSLSQHQGLYIYIYTYIYLYIYILVLIYT